MPGEFIPFAATLRSKASAPASGASSRFAPVVSAPSISAPQEPADQPVPAHSHREISVDLQRDGDRISRITIQCRCGEVIELDCEY